MRLPSEPGSIVGAVVLPHDVLIPSGVEGAARPAALVRFRAASAAFHGRL
jgi:hypothetical protein